MHHWSIRIPVLMAAVPILLLVTACSFHPPAASLTGVAVTNLGDPSSQTAVYPFDAVVVTGSGVASGAPDFAQLSLAVSVTDDSVAQARDAAAETMKDVRAALKRQRLLDSDIGTSHFRIHPEYEYGPDGREQVGYTVRNGLSVKVRDSDKVAAVIDSAVAAGGDYLVFNNIGFSFSDPSELEKQAREAAVKDMGAKAAQLAEFSGRELGDLKVVSEGIFDETNLPDGAFLLRAEATDFDTPISTGEGAITVSITGVYELK